MSMAAPEVFLKYREWLTTDPKQKDFHWVLKPGAPEEAKKLYEKFKKTFLDMEKEGKQP
jgi:hypothetical protein